MLEAVAILDDPRVSSTFRAASPPLTRAKRVWTGGAGARDVLEPLASCGTVGLECTGCAHFDPARAETVCHASKRTRCS